MKISPTNFEKIWLNLIKPIQNYIYRINSIESNIVDAEKVGTVVQCIVPKHVEKVVFPQIYGLTKSAEIDFEINDLNLILFHQAMIFPKADYILTGDGIVWYKFQKTHFTKNLPFDFGLLKINKNQMAIRKPKKTLVIEQGFSMCGVYSTVWSHFLVQYLPKLYLIQDLISKTDLPLIVIVPEYTDSHIRQVVMSYLNKISNIEVLEINDQTSVLCKKLYYIESISDISDACKYPFPSDIIITEFVANSLKNNLVNRFIEKLEIVDEYARKQKIYIIRRGKRNLINYKEVELFFKEKGFYFVEPHKLTLIEKISIFKNAEVVVGPLSSGFTNLIFSNKSTKVLVLSNFVRSFEGYFAFISNYFVKKIILLTGSDNSSHLNTSYIIPIDKVEKAYNDLFI